MPPKVRELITDLEQAGFRNMVGKGSHRNYVHPNVVRPITLSCNPGTDANPRQVRDVRRAIEESQK